MNSVYDSQLYKDVLDAQAIRQAADKMVSLFFHEVDRLEENQFLLRADEFGISEAEHMFHIIPDKSVEDLEFRRQRVINRNTTKPPYTFRYLKEKLDELFGAENYIIRRDMETRTLYVESSVESAGWYNEVSLTVNKLKPANLVYINNPYVDGGIRASETISVMQFAKNYLLGVWKLGQKPFVTKKDGGIIKDMGINSMSEDYLSAIAESSLSKIAKARINGTIEITEFEVKKSEENQCTLEYLILPGQVKEITSLELLDETGTVLTSATVYIAVTDSVQIKHKFVIKEG